MCLCSDDGVIYAIGLDGNLHWHRHEGRFNGYFSWHIDSGKNVSSGWASLNFKQAFSVGDGIIYVYVVRNKGELAWIG